MYIWKILKPNLRNWDMAFRTDPQAAEIGRLAIKVVNLYRQRIGEI